MYLFKIQNIYSPMSNLACQSGCDVKDDPLKVFAESLYDAHCKFSLHIAHCSLQIAHFQCTLYIVLVCAEYLCLHFCHMGQFLQDRTFLQSLKEKINSPILRLLKNV